MAVAKATLFIRQYRRQWVVDMDLSKCFDRLDHELIIASISQRVKDGSILKLIEIFLKGGVMIDHQIEATEIGSSQGGVISPAITYLDAFDQEMKRRGHRIVRYADDILILCATRTGAEHAQTVATEILEGGLKLTVNQEKTHLAHFAYKDAIDMNAAAGDELFCRWTDPMGGGHDYDFSATWGITGQVQVMSNGTMRGKVGYPYNGRKYPAPVGSGRR